MNCMKCGRETDSEQIFCESCLLQMEKYPIKPDTAVKLPERRETTAFRRTPKRRAANLEEQVKALKRRVVRLTIVLVLAVILILLMTPSTIEHLLEDRYKPGQNYSVITPEDSDASAVTGTP